MSMTKNKVRQREIQPARYVAGALKKRRPTPLDRGLASSNPATLDASAAAQRCSFDGAPLSIQSIAELNCSGIRMRLDRNHAAAEPAISGLPLAHAQEISSTACSIEGDVRQSASAMARYSLFAAGTRGRPGSPACSPVIGVRVVYRQRGTRFR
jgi:hypothetical protein